MILLVMKVPGLKRFNALLLFAALDCTIGCLAAPVYTTDVALYDAYPLTLHESVILMSIQQYHDISIIKYDII